MRCAKGSSALLPWLADTLDGGLVVVRVLVLGLGPLDLFCPASPLAVRWSRCPQAKFSAHRSAKRVRDGFLCDRGTPKA